MLAMSLPKVQEWCVPPPTVSHICPTAPQWVPGPRGKRLVNRGNAGEVLWFESCRPDA